MILGAPRDLRDPHLVAERMDLLQVMPRPRFSVIGLRTSHSVVQLWCGTSIPARQALMRAFFCCLRRLAR
jgi:hypothetical protein